MARTIHCWGLIDSTDSFCLGEFMVKEGDTGKRKSPKKIAQRQAMDNCKCSRECIKKVKKRKEVKKREETKVTEWLSEWEKYWSNWSIDPATFCLLTLVCSCICSYTKLHPTWTIVNAREKSTMWLRKNKDQKEKYIISPMSNTWFTLAIDGQCTVRCKKKELLTLTQQHEYVW